MYTEMQRTNSQDILEIIRNKNFSNMYQDLLDYDKSDKFMEFINNRLMEQNRDQTQTHTYMDI